MSASDLAGGLERDNFQTLSGSASEFHVWGLKYVQRLVNLSVVRKGVLTFAKFTLKSYKFLRCYAQLTLNPTDTR